MFWLVQISKDWVSFSSILSLLDQGYFAPGNGSNNLWTTYEFTLEWRHMVRLPTNSCYSHQGEFVFTWVKRNRQKSHTSSANWVKLAWNYLINWFRKYFFKIFIRKKKKTNWFFWQFFKKYFLKFFIGKEQNNRFLKKKIHKNLSKLYYIIH